MEYPVRIRDDVSVCVWSDPSRGKGRRQTISKGAVGKPNAGFDFLSVILISLAWNILFQLVVSSAGCAFWYYTTIPSRSLAESRGYSESAGSFSVTAMRRKIGTLYQCSPKTSLLILSNGSAHGTSTVTE